MTSKLIAVLGCAAVACWSAGGSPAGQPDAWKDWGFILGRWEGEGSGKPGEGKGGFTFQRDLEGRVLVRRNHSEYPATAGRPAITHDDLMVVFREGERIRAIYFDNEGHVIHYGVEFSEGKRRLVFLSEDAAPGPRFRLTYEQSGGDQLDVTFEMAAPGQAEFKRYTKGTVRRK